MATEIKVDNRNVAMQSKKKNWLGFLSLLIFLRIWFKFFAAETEIRQLLSILLLSFSAFFKYLRNSMDH